MYIKLEILVGELPLFNVYGVKSNWYITVLFTGISVENKASFEPILLLLPNKEKTEYDSKPGVLLFLKIRKVIIRIT